MDAVVDQVVTYLEMTSPGQLRPGRPPGHRVGFERVGVHRSELARATHDRIGAPHGWSRLSGPGWHELLRRATTRAWIVRVPEAVAGLVVLDLQPDANIEVGVFGLVPEWVGRGLGGHALTRALELAWNQVDPLDLAPARRVWLHTSSVDHPRALANYLGRGLRPFWSRASRGEIAS